MQPSFYLWAIIIRNQQQAYGSKYSTHLGWFIYGKKDPKNHCVMICTNLAKSSHMCFSLKQLQSWLSKDSRDLLRLESSLTWGKVMIRLFIAIVLFSNFSSANFKISSLVKADLFGELIGKWENIKKDIYTANFFELEKFTPMWIGKTVMLFGSIQSWK